jgi:hypothetical protein
MSNVEITLKLPESLVRRAYAAGVRIEKQQELLIALLESQIRRQEAAKRLLSMAEQLSALPDDVKPTPDKIALARRAYWDTKSDES